MSNIYPNFCISEEIFCGTNISEAYAAKILYLEVNKSNSCKSN